MSRFDSKGYPAVYRIEDIDKASREGVIQTSVINHNLTIYSNIKEDHIAIMFGKKFCTD